MKCKNCEAEWTVSKNLNKITRCPFCGADLKQESEEQKDRQGNTDAKKRIEELNQKPAETVELDVEAVYQEGFKYYNKKNLS